VATRRLQQVLDLIFPSPRPREIRKLRRRLRRCRSSLSEVRNCDVLLERVDAALARKRTAHREARKAIRQYLLTRRAATFEKALRKLTRANLSELYVRMKDYLLGDGGAFSAGASADHHSGGPSPSVEQFYAHIGENLQSMWEALEEQMARSRRKPEAAVLHHVRIAAKRLRYLGEVVHAFDVPGSPEALIWLRNLQKHLGQWHDLVVFEETVIEMIADPAFLRDHMELGLEIERLILRNRVLKVKLEGKYLEATADQADLLRTKDWVSRIIAAPSAVFTTA
jgi:CHAD domain-containing protein